MSGHLTDDLTDETHRNEVIVIIGKADVYVIYFIGLGFVYFKRKEFGIHLPGERKI